MDAPMLTDREIGKRLSDARSVLLRSYRAAFGKGRRDGNRMYSDDGRLALEWRVRMYPNLPESYENQQTSRGTVVCIEIPEAR